MEEPLLDLDEIQGHIVNGFNSNNQVLVFLRLEDINKARSLLRTLSKHVTTARVTHLFRQARRILREQLTADPPIDMVSVAAAFTFKGLAKVAPECGGLPKSAFVVGADSRSTFLGDPTDQTDLGNVNNWLYGNSANPVDLLVIVASDDANKIENELGVIFGCVPAPGSPLPNFGLFVVAVEHGADLPGELAGHEHFGFKDGISQPALRGRSSAAPDEFLAPRPILPNAGAIAKIQSLPGQDLVWPGEFVLGYERQDDRTAGNSLPPAEVPLPWMKNGSFLVYRRLRQDVAGFRAFVERVQTAMGNPPSELTRVQASLVGRWASGAPVLRSSTKDEPTLAADKYRNNAFRFLSDFPQVDVSTTNGKETVPRAPADEAGLVCPHYAHVRKVNPRDVSTEAGNARSHRILRRGIPYGPLFNVPDHEDRGLLFLCYQALIEDGFETIQVNWANRSDQPQNGGHDILIGQPDGGAPRTIDVQTQAGTTIQVQLASPLVRPTAAGYFFSPSMSALVQFAST
jgi:Dyp-type peroxidase family